MKKIIIILISSLVLISCKDKSGFDIETIDLNTNIEWLLPKKEDRTVEVGLIHGKKPYSFNDIESFRFGDITFTNGGQFDYPLNEIVFYLNDDEQSLAAIDIVTNKPAEITTFFNYLTSKYGQPVILKREPKPDANGKIMGSATYVWKNIGNNRSILLFKNY